MNTRQKRPLKIRELQNPIKHKNHKIIKIDCIGIHFFKNNKMGVYDIPICPQHKHYRGIPTNTESIKENTNISFCQDCQTVIINLEKD